MSDIIVRGKPHRFVPHDGKSVVVPIASKASVDQAWEDYASYAQALKDDPDKLTDRDYHEELIRRYNRWKHLFSMEDA